MTGSETFNKTKLTFARFLRHSVQAFGVTTPRPRRLFEYCELDGGPDALDDPVEPSVWLVFDLRPDEECRPAAGCGVLPVLG